ncbi:DUF2357 domain-containing protein [Halomonas piscis]|uniref:DUF2357 domain-containing protein n=1 Tax=Halomonas piscis TaxID=3031727 RepID=UPI0028A0D40C|nr:DUF2357 domain-containing protein [Halomonas piscis]
MQELLRLQTKDFVFSVWCKDIASRQQTYAKTLSQRAADNKAPTPAMRLSPTLLLEEASIMGLPRPDCLGQANELPLGAPLFFENLQYHFEWIFFNEIQDAWLCHRLASVNNGFRFTAKRGPIPAMLSGSIYTGNHLGWLKLPLSYMPVNGTTHSQSFSFEVLPTKMDLHSDLAVMYSAIDATFPLWRFSLVEKTQQGAVQSRQNVNFPLLWLANFAQLREQFEQGLKVIARAPHRRLQSYSTWQRADRIKGRLPQKLAERAREDLASGRIDKRYRVERRRLSVNTPENRFIRSIVLLSQQRLYDFERRLKKHNNAPDNQRISASFLDELHQWQQPLHKMLRQSFLKEVEAARLPENASLVLQQKPGYSTVYRIWQQLKRYLDVFDGMTGVSMKSIAEIYEIWCFLTLRQILADELGFIERHRSSARLFTSSTHEYQFKDGFAGAFIFDREDGAIARLAHEPLFQQEGTNPRTYLIAQKPDIVLEITFPEPAKPRFLWVFDAKYRIKNEKSTFETADVDATDYVPDDAINQMHRYRDALISFSCQNNAYAQSKSRPVCGAFALYPGNFDQYSEQNPYADALSEVGIGAFALLPSLNSRKGCLWLTQFLRQQIGTAEQPMTREDLLVQETARIPHYGMEQTRYSDLIMTIAVAGAKSRPPDYLKAFAHGTAKWYHTPQSTFQGKYRQHVVEEIRFLALATTSDKDTTTKQLDKLWPVKKVTLVPRDQLTVEQAGKAKASSEPYYLFKLGKPLTLQHPIKKVPHRPIQNSMRLTTLSRLEKADTFREVERVYPDALAAQS